MGVTAVLIPSVICKPAEEIEKATGKEEQFRVVKGRVIEKNLPCISPFEFTAAIKGNFFRRRARRSGNAPFRRLFFRRRRS